MIPGRFDHPSYDQLRDLGRQHGYNRKHAKEVLRTRLTSTPDEQASSTHNSPMDLDAPEPGNGIRGCPPADVVEHLQGPTFAPDKRCKRDILRVGSVADKEVVKGHAQWWGSELKPQVEASRSSAVEGAESAI